MYTKEFKKINFIRSVSPGEYQNNLELNVYDLSYGNGISSDGANLEISDYGEHKFKGKEFRCLECKYFRWKSFDSYKDVIQTLVFEQFIAFDENEGLTVYAYKDKQDILIKKENIISAKLYSSEI